MNNRKKFFHLILLLSILIPSAKLKADNYYWVGGTGSWADYIQHWAVSSGGQLYHDHVPTPNDTVIFDSLSFTAINDTVYADSSILYCYTMRWENVQGHPVFLNAYNSTNTFLKIYGSLFLDTGMSWQYSGAIRFNTFDPSQHFNPAAHYFPNLSFEGDTSGQVFLDDSLRAGSLLVYGGELHSNGNLVRVNYFYQPNYAPSSVFLDTSIVCAYFFQTDQSTGNFDADSATIYISGHWFFCNGIQFRKIITLTSVELIGSNQIDTLILNAGATIVGSNTIGKLSFRARASLLVLEAGSTQTILDTLIFNGACEGISAIESSLAGSSAAISKTGGTILCDRVLLEDISAAGGANFMANNSVLTNCSGWTTTNIPSPRSLFWVGNTGNWSDTSHWSLSSGGSGGECAPTPLDSVIMDGQSFSSSGDVLTVDNPFLACGDMDCSLTTGIFYGNSLVDIYGSLLLNPAFNFSTNNIRLRSPSPGKLLQPGNNPFGNLALYATGSYDLQGNIAASDFLFLSGSFNSGAFGISAGKIRGTGSPASAWLFAGSDVSCGEWWMSPSTNFSSPAKITVHSFSDFTAHIYDTVIFPAGAMLNANCTFSEMNIAGNAQIYGNNTYGSLHLLTPGALIQFQQGSTQTILNQFDAVSNCGAMTMLQSTLAGNSATLSMASGAITLNDVIIEDLTATGGGTFNALNSVATFNVTGWNVTPPPAVPMYWIGGTGSWNDPQHWSATSGGTPGICIPNPLTDVYFDSLSFSPNADTVSIITAFNYCHSMDWTGCTGAPKLFSTSPLNTLRIYGSMLLDNNVSANQSILLFRSHTPGETINTNGQPLGYIRIDGFNGTFDLLQPMQADSLEIINGTFKTAGQQLNVNIMRSDSTSTRGLLLDSSVVFAQNWFVLNDNQLTLDASSAHLNISGTRFFGGYHRKYKEVYFSNAVKIYDADTFGIARFTNMATIEQSCSFDTLFLDNPGYSISFGAGTTQTLNGKFYASATAQQMTGVESSDVSGTVSFIKTQDTLCTDFLVLRAMAASGGAVFYAGQYSSDAGNNSGWTFQDCSPQTIDVWPGDANRDLVDDNLDLLALGVAFGNSRTARANASNSWTPQPSWIWETLFANASDIVNADCDGNGTIGFSDTTAILLNYGSTHPARLVETDSVQSAGLPFYFSVPQNPVAAGDTTSVGFMLGTNSFPAANIYGIAFTLHYTANSLLPGSEWLSFTNAWLAPMGYVIYIVKEFPAQNKMELAISRIDHQNMSGTGEIGRLHFTVDPAAQGVFKCWYTDVTMIDFSETESPVQTIMGSFQIAVGIEELSQQGFNAYPNPTNGDYVIDDAKLTGVNSIITVMDMSGRKLQEMKTHGESSVVLHLEDFPAGIYFVRLENEKGIYREKVVKE